ncbi:MAG: HAMP domain-containing sensor histidine kinase [Anaerolineae bacterium]|nr:HAMP domain-containing sensor histidine kinase [Anaerolineae bacterium]
MLIGFGVTVVFVALKLSATLPHFDQPWLLRFTQQDYMKETLLPSLIGLFVLGVATVLVQINPRSPAITLFGFLTLSVVFLVLSQPAMGTGLFGSPTFAAHYLGTIIIPPLLLHFLLLFPYRRRALLRQPYVLPLIYLPVIPGVIHLATVSAADTMPNFSHLLDVYTAVYISVGVGLLMQSLWRGKFLIRKRATVILAGFMLPFGFTVYFALVGFFDQPLEPTVMYELSQRYIFWSIPISIAFAILRYDVLGKRRVGHQYILYTGIIGGLLTISLLLIGEVSSVRIGFGRLATEDYRTILFTIVGVFALRYFHHRFRRWQAKRTMRQNLDDFKVNVRILVSELLKVKSRHELESLISWNMATDFALQSAEISARDLASSPYALRLPLAVNNIPLGTLFLGPKISGETFSEQEQVLFLEAQKQISLALLSLELDEAIQVTEELTALKSKFLTNVTHELRTPLNGIINYIGFVRDDVGQTNPVQAIYLAEALRGAENLLHLINNILDMSKIEAGQMTLDRGRVDLKVLVSDVMPTINEMVADKPITVVTEVRPDARQVYGDYLRLRQIMLNIVSNAVKYTERGNIYFQVFRENGNVVIKVSDNGPGIEEALLPTIFEQFGSSDFIDTGRRMGSGLGMPITKSLVELHNGQITVESKANVGTTFTINLPV